LAKLIGRRSAPDSVKSRHILLQGADARKTADSLLAVLNTNPAQWDSINVKFSTDAGAKTKGGDLGYQPQGQFVAPFNDLIFYKAQQGKYYTVETQFGVHIVQVTGVKAGANETRVKVAYVREPIIPGAETDRKASTAADELLASSKSLEDLRKNAQAKNLAIQPSTGFRSYDVALGQFGRADGVRQIIRWAFESKVGERSKNTFALREEGEGYNSRYVVAAVKAITPKGVPSLKDLKEQLTPFVKNRKKGEVLKTRITTQDLNAIATQFNSKVDTARGVTFNATFVPNLGSEPAVLGSVFTVDNGQVTKPIVGQSAVFIAKVVNKTKLENSPVNKDDLRPQLTTSVKSTLRSSLVRSLRKKADITDNRLKFF
jgi:peptidyl-prolyl cis-trans isomerase D